MWNFVGIVGAPQELYPRNVQLVVKLMKEFQKQCFIKKLDVDDPEAPCFLGLQTISQAARELHFSPCSIFLVQIHLLLILSSISSSFGENLSVHMA